MFCIQLFVTLNIIAAAHSYTSAVRINFLPRYRAPAFWRLVMLTRKHEFHVQKGRAISFFISQNLALFFWQSPQWTCSFRQRSCCSSVGRLAAPQSSKSLPGGQCVHGWYSLLIWLGGGDRDAWTICHLRTRAPLLINWANIRWRHQTFAQKWTHIHTHTPAILGFGRWWPDRLPYSAFSWAIFLCISCQSSTVCPLYQQSAGDNTLEPRLRHNGPKIRTPDGCNKQWLRGRVFQIQTRP